MNRAKLLQDLQRIEKLRGYKPGWARRQFQVRVGNFTRLSRREKKRVRKELTLFIDIAFRHQKKPGEWWAGRYSGSATESAQRLSRLSNEVCKVFKKVYNSNPDDSIDALLYVRVRHMKKQQE